MRVLLVGLVFALAACTDPSLGVGVTVGPKGVSVKQSVSTNLGGVNVTVSR